jgi:hypothetical protein
MSYRVEFCGVAVYPLDLSPKEACGKELPCEDHPEVDRQEIIDCDTCTRSYRVRDGMTGNMCPHCNRF